MAEEILLALSRKPGSSDCTPWSFSGLSSKDRPVKAFHFFVRNFGASFLPSIEKKDILEIGCGIGRESVAIAVYGAKSAIGIDIRSTCISKAKRFARHQDVSRKVEFVSGDASNMCFVENCFDCIVSKDSMEHFLKPEKVLNECKRILEQGGRLYISFGPPWLSPYGSHMYSFTKVPWVNVFFSEKTVMAVRSRFRNDGAKKYTEVEGGLNKMTIRRFNRIVESSGLRTVSFSVKGLPILKKIPIIREFFSTYIACILQKP